MVRVGDIHSFDKTPLEVRDIAAAFGGTLLPAAQSILKQSILKTPSLLRERLTSRHFILCCTAIGLWYYFLQDLRLSRINSLSRLR
jgi:hypothetical protein